MSLIRSVLQLNGSFLQCSLVRRINPVRACQTGNSIVTESTDDVEKESTDNGNKQSTNINTVLNTLRNNKSTVVTIKKGDKRNIIPISTCMEYMRSSAYRKTYGDNPVWKEYRRNHKGGQPPRKTRRTCIRKGLYATSNPCPICRDEYLMFDYQNTDLLKQFIAEHNGETISYTKTGICQVRHRQLLIAILKAKDYGTLTFDLPIRQYNYSDWYKPESQGTLESKEPKQAADACAN